MKYMPADKSTRSTVLVVIGGVVLVPLMSVGIGLYLWFWYPFQEVDRSAGEFSSQKAATQASIRRLSAELRRRPGTETFTIWFHWVNRDETKGLRATVYNRPEKILGYSVEPTSGLTERWTNIDVATIHAIAATNGDFTSFGKPSYPMD